MRGKSCRRLAAALILSALLPLLWTSGCAGKERTQAKEQTEAYDSISIGEDVTLYIEKTEYMSQVKPPTPMGYYDYYPEEEGWRYLVISGTTENRGTKDFDPADCYVESYVDGAPREGKLLILAGPGTEFWDVIPAGSGKGSWDFYLFTLIREEEEPEGISLFYNDSLIKSEEGESWDHEIRLTVPKGAPAPQSDKS